MAGKETTRVQFELPATAMQRLRTLQGWLEATSYADVVKTALKLLALVVEAQRNGRSIYIEGENDTRTQLHILL